MSRAATVSTLQDWGRHVSDQAPSHSSCDTVYPPGGERPEVALTQANHCGVMSVLSLRGVLGCVPP